jgi:hypothetical protein
MVLVVLAWLGLVLAIVPMLSITWGTLQLQEHTACGFAADASYVHYRLKLLAVLWGVFALPVAPAVYLLVARKTAETAGGAFGLAGLSVGISFAEFLFFAFTTMC